MSTVWHSLNDTGWEQFGSSFHYMGLTVWLSLHDRGWEQFGSSYMTWDGNSWLSLHDKGWEQFGSACMTWDGNSLALAYIIWDDNSLAQLTWQGIGTFWLSLHDMGWDRDSLNSCYSLISQPNIPKYWYVLWCLWSYLFQLGMQITIRQNNVMPISVTLIFIQGRYVIKLPKLSDG